MSTTDYIVNGLLIALVIRQIHGKKLTAFGLIWPVGVVVWAGYSYLHGIPTAGNDLLLVMTGISVGATLGILCGAFTHLHLQADGSFLAKAGFAAAALWIVGVGSRLAFELYATHGGSANHRPLQCHPQHHLGRGLDGGARPHGVRRSPQSDRRAGLEGSFVADPDRTRPRLRLRLPTHRW